MKNSIFGILLFLATCVQAQDQNYSSTEVNINPYIKGTLITPSSTEPGPLVIMLQGSGPTDRNGNQSFLKNDSMKKIAIELAEKGIASYRYDKRILQAQRLGIKEQDVRFDDFVTDANSVLDHFKEDPRFTEVIILGHSQGSLVGMIAAREKADAFISIAGLAQPVDSMLTRQIATQLPGLEQSARQSFSELRDTGSTTNYSPMLEFMFRPSLQPFILSWMKFDPKNEISNLDIPVLLINGTNDLQVDQKEAEELKKAKPEAELVLLENMNHVLKKIDGDALENSKSYSEAHRPLHPELVNVIAGFVNSLK